MSQQGNRRHIIVFAVITAMCLVGDSMLYIVLPVHYQSMGLSSLWEVGIVLAVNRIVRLPLNPCIGWFYSHISERTGILIAVVLATATTLSYGFLPNLAFWILARSVWGVAWTLLRLGSLFCILKLSTPTNRGQYTGLYNGLYRLGSLVGMLFGGLLADVAGVTVTVLLFGAISASAFFLALGSIPSGMDPQDSHDQGVSLRTSLAAVWQDASVFWIVAAGGIVAFVVQGVIASTLSRLIADHARDGLALFGMVVGASSVAGFLQALRWGWEPWLAPFTGRFSDTHMGRPRMLAWASAAGAIILLLVALPLPLPAWFLCLVAMQVAATVLTTVSEATAADVASVSSGRALLMGYALIMDLGAAFGPLAAYFLNEFMGINAAYVCSGILLALLFWKRRVYAHAGGA